MSEDVPPATDVPAATPVDPVSAEPARKVRVSFFITLILSAILIYCASAGPAVYLAVLTFRQFERTEWIETAFYTLYRPHLDLCYRREGYFAYINWFIVKAGGNSRTHAEFKEFWAVQGGYRRPGPSP